ncbi:hypothetical protein [Bacillus cereus]|uniref:hypothetical protein n=1 Tax=Bacillus cereus TaxID=1396 RepID=UPI001124CDB4|nr:hypothetical protein [Bacillus cereus]
MNITLNNIVGAGEKSTHIHIENEELTTQQKHRTIAISVSIQRRGSVWWRLMKWILKHNEVSLCVQTSPSDVYIQPKDEFMINEIEANYERGFNILIKDIFVQLSQRKKGFSIMKKYEFFVLDHPDFTFPAASTYIIEPVVQVDKKDGIAPQWLYRFVCKRLLKYETETHEVKVFRR